MSLYKSDDIQEMKEFAKNVTEIIAVETDLHVTVIFSQLEKNLITLVLPKIWNF